jgi:hypothetical protein
MTALRSSHAVWLQRRASMLEANSPDASGEPPDPARATQLHEIATKVVEAVNHDRLLVLMPEEHALLVTEAHALGERAEEELRRPSDRNLSRAEVWVMIARALREVVEATG